MIMLTALFLPAKSWAEARDDSDLKKYLFKHLGCKVKNLNFAQNIPNELFGFSDNGELTNHIDTVNSFGPYIIDQKPYGYHWVYRDICADGQAAITVSDNEDYNLPSKKHAALCGPAPLFTPRTYINFNEINDLGVSIRDYDKYMFLRARQLFDKPCLAWQPPEISMDQQQKKLIQKTIAAITHIKETQNSIPDQIYSKLKDDFECEADASDIKQIYWMGGIYEDDYYDTYYQINCSNQSTIKMIVWRFKDQNDKFNLYDCDHHKFTEEFISERKGPMSTHDLICPKSK